MVELNVTTVVYSHRHKIKTFQSDDTDKMCSFIENWNDGELFLCYIRGSVCEYMEDNVYITDLFNILRLLKIEIHKIESF